MTCPPSFPKILTTIIPIISKVLMSIDYNLTIIFRNIKDENSPRLCSTNEKKCVCVGVCPKPELVITFFFSNLPASSCQCRISSVWAS